MIKNSLKERTVFLGIGNPLRGDDGAGCKFIRELKRWGAGRRKGIYLFNGEQLPENYLEPIVKIQPATVVLVDAVDFGAPAGEVKVFEEAGSQPGFSTHTLSLSLLLNYLREATQAKIFILGIQPKKTRWGEGLSKEVEATIKGLVNWLIREENEDPNQSR